MCAEAVVEGERPGQADALLCDCVVVVVAGATIFSEESRGRGPKGTRGPRRAGRGGRTEGRGGDTAELGGVWLSLSPAGPE